MIRSASHGEVHEIALARPEKRNALTPDMLRDLLAPVRAIGPDAKCLLLSGDGSTFCAGFDLSLCKDSPDGTVMRSLLTGLHDCIGALRSLEIPVVISAQGAAIAGGCALLGGGDIIVTNAEAKLGYPVARLGVSPAVSAPFLQNLVGDGVARARELENGLIDGRAALACGLAHECLDTPEAVRDRSLEIATNLASKPPQAMAATKHWLAEIEPIRLATEGLQASLGRVGSDEERRLLPQAWNTVR
jgi:enoyl-CoA hydratase